MTATTLRSSTFVALALAAIWAFFAAPADAAGVTVARATALQKGDMVTGALPATQYMHVVVALRLRNRDALLNLLAANRKPTTAEFSAQHAPTTQQALVVANYLGSMGFKNVVIASNRLLVTADGTAASASAAFQTSFVRVKTAEGRQAFANNTDATLPSVLQDSVVSVLGLQNVHQVRSHAKLLAASPAAVAAHNPVDFSPIYGGTGMPTAAGVTVGIMTVGDLSQPIADLNTFTAANGLPQVVTQTVDTNGTSADTQGALEWSLDSQAIVGAAGGRVGKIIFYNAPSFLFTDLVLDINTAVTANVAKIINISLGACELFAQSTGAAAASDELFLAAVAQGQTFSISTGDVGANTCAPQPGFSPSWPASSPYVVAVNGTLLNASATTWQGEVVWNNLPKNGATGGSPSTFEPKPSWQNALVPGSKRGVADVAFTASPFSGALVYLNGALVRVGGTSLSAPIFAGLWARVIAAKGTAVGFAAPLLYQLPASDFHDVVSGNNGGYSALPGYDFASGRGSLILNRAISHIPGGAANAAPVTNFSYTAVGLIATFTDRSTDSDGTISARSWTFGDGHASTLANPRQIYAKAGTYSVTEKVVDNAGASSSKTVSVVVGR